MDDAQTGLRGGSIGILHIVFFVIATAGPLVSLVGAAPAAIAMGNGIGLPGVYLLVSCLYTLFSVGFTAMSRHVNNAGAFYAYITKGFGANWGVAGAMVAILAYSAVQIGTYALFGIFCRQAVGEMGGPAIEWWIYALGILVVIGFIGQRTILFSGRILGLLLILEMLVIVGLDLAIFASGAHFSAEPFSPSRVFSTGFGAALAFVVPCFLGFEATAIFGEEARDPERSIPIATYVSILTIGGLYAISSWTILFAYPLDQVVTIAAGHSSTLFFDAANRLIGPGYVVAMNALMITSMFAGMLSLHNTLARYFFSLGRAGILPDFLSRTHRRHQSPHLAGLAQSLVAAGALLLLVIFRADPYAVVFAWFAALSAVAILAVQCVTSLAIFAFFRRQGAGWDGRTIIAPLLAALGLGVSTALLVVNLPLIAGTNAAEIWFLPLAVVAAAAIGFLRARQHHLSRDDVEALGQEAAQAQ